LRAAEQRLELAPAVGPRQPPDITASNGEHVEGNDIIAPLWSRRRDPPLAMTAPSRLKPAANPSVLGRLQAHQLAVEHCAAIPDGAAP
jgi:hypothetical protein